MKMSCECFLNLKSSLISKSLNLLSYFSYLFSSAGRTALFQIWIQLEFSQKLPDHNMLQRNMKNFSPHHLIFQTRVYLYNRKWCNQICCRRTHGRQWSSAVSTLYRSNTELYKFASELELKDIWKYQLYFRFGISYQNSNTNTLSLVLFCYAMYTF